MKSELSHWALNTTVRCQHRCVYCFEGRREGLKDVAFEETRKVLEQAAKEVPAVIFMGAEPTLNPALPELIAYAAGLGLRPSISTNAIRLSDPAFLKKLHDNGLHTIELSFPYPDAETYARVTRAKPAGFHRLLAALDNIRELNASLPPARRHPVHANVVVSRFNLERLDAVLGHLGRRLPAGGFNLTLKRVTLADAIDEEFFRKSVNVPLAELRRVLPGLPPPPPGTSLSFRDFPLCAIPGREKQEAELGYLLDSVEVRNNFFTQKKMVDMYPRSRLRQAHPFDWICENCALEPLCLHRGLFYKAPSDGAHAPRAASASEARPVLEWARTRSGGGILADAKRPSTALGLALGKLLRQAPPGPGLAGTKAAWEPLENGTLLLRLGKSSARLRLGEASPGMPALRPESPPVLPRWAARGAAALAEILGARAPAPPGVDAAIGLRFPEAFAAAVGRIPALKGFRAESLGAGVFALRARGREGQGWLSVGPAGGPPAPGFLCRGLRLSATQPEASAGPLPWLGAALQACLELENPEPGDGRGFLSLAWRIFKKSLWPRTGSFGVLSEGWVGAEEIRLVLAAPEGRPFQIVLAPQRRVERPWVRNAGIGLGLQISDGGEPDAPQRRIIEAYARLLQRP